MHGDQDNTAKATAPHHLAPLTSLRFFAAAAVLLFHMAGLWGMPPRQNMPFGIGVDLFFVLSGFILAYNYRTIAGLGGALRLIAYRIARIWPLHVVTLIAAFALLPDPASPFKDISKVWSSILLVQSWLGNWVYVFNGNSVSWTLSVEMAFYLAFPFLIMMSGRAMLVALALVSVATIAWASIYWMPVELSDDVTSGEAIVRTHPGAYLVLFVAGILAGRAFYRRSWTAVPTHAASILEFAAVALCVFYFLYNQAMLNFVAWRWGLDPLLLWLKTACGILFLLPVVFVLAIGRGWISTLLRRRVMVLLGDISFATYMCHQIVLLVIVRSEASGGIAIGTTVAIVYAMSFALYFGVERPAQRLLRKWIDALWPAEREKRLASAE